ncbi:MAG: dTDP-4-dehydrorhamnose 3,5-epimerase [Chloroflexi bacterium]|nr:dTDP-4-dehydrorhamnose 3,5-epimerase [Chloroflexota bacterium]
MKFIDTGLKDAYSIELEPISDQRGFFARIFCVDEMRALGMETDIVQVNMSHNLRKGVVRGMHYQVAPAPEAKLMRCIRGAIYDVIVDMREDSPTYLQWFGIELSAENRKALYVPPMFAHGYQALTDGAEVFYPTTGVYTPSCERGIRHDDPAIGIQWPIPPTEISAKDQSWPLLIVERRTPVAAR